MAAPEAQMLHLDNGSLTSQCNVQIALYHRRAFSLSFVISEGHYHSKRPVQDLEGRVRRCSVGPPSPMVSVPLQYRHLYFGDFSFIENTGAFFNLI